MYKLLFILLISALPGFAVDISLGEPSYGGTGCPQGSAAAVLSQDGKSLSLLFDQYVVEAGGISGNLTARKSCNIAVPVHVPQGVSLSVFQVDYRGFNSLPPQSYSQFRVEYFFAGSKGPAYKKTFAGAQQDFFFLSDLIPQNLIVWTPCGEDVILRSNSSLLVRTNRGFDEAFSSVDTADFNSGLLYHIEWQYCV